MQRHLLRSTGTDALDALLTWCKYEFVEQDAPIPAAATAAGASDGSGSRSAAVAVFAGPADRSGLVKSLPPDVGQPMAKVVEAANGIDPQVSQFHEPLNLFYEPLNLSDLDIDDKSRMHAICNADSHSVLLLSPFASLALTDNTCLVL